MASPALFELVLTPTGRLCLLSGGAGSSALAPFAESFERSSAAGLLALSSHRASLGDWQAEAVYWRDFANGFLQAVAHSPEGVGDAEAVAPPTDRFFDLVLRLPAMRGAEYVTPDTLTALWQELTAEAATAARAGGGLKAWLSSINPALSQLGRVTFHLAENKRSPDRPFAFMATFTHRLSSKETPVHLPLARALQEYAGARNQAALRSLLEPVQRAAERSRWAADLLESRRVFQPLAWSPPEAHAFLQEAALLEDCGIMVRIPNWWRGGAAPRPRVQVRLGDAAGSGLGADALLNFQASVALDGDPLTEAEIKSLLTNEGGLVLLRGQWVEVDSDKLQSVLDHWRAVEKAATDGVSFLQGLRLLAGFRDPGTATADDDPVAVAAWSNVAAGDWLRQTLETIRHPERVAAIDPGRDLRATLRPYQAQGARWLWFLQSLGLGACLADDMGLGKTLQVIALLAQLKREVAPPLAPPSLLIAPASLLTNWTAEIARFAPRLRALIAHPSAGAGDWWKSGQATAPDWRAADLVLTTYGQAARLKWLAEHRWRLVILDEAQAIKNPGAQQTKTVKRLQAGARLALSGTPVENRPGDLWSLFDFLNPGLLGSASDFSRSLKSMQHSDPPDYSTLRRLVQPWILRRLKTDRSIIADLPDKTEVTVSCGLTKKQAALYEHTVREMAERLAHSDGIQRRGLVLAYLMRFKQICNHPAQGVPGAEFDASHSGKFLRLGEIAEEIASRQEKLLVFTQFQEMTAPLERFLRDVFGRPGLVLHGGTPIKERSKLVEAFQRDGGSPFFVLSLKAGGSGLTLTAASHVFHFDRWWNPAVENQATDRAYRIGQKRPVLVHKCVCRGTVEERIDTMLAEKRQLADSLLGPDGGPEKLLTEMSNDELMSFVSLDLASAAADLS
ncbi:MAG: DEAD/DEAH box helicase [Verrucomicrobiales bacterium]